MTTTIFTPTDQEARRIAVAAIEGSPGANKGDFEKFDTMFQLQAIAGVVRIVDALQVLGYRISPPLKEVK